MLPLAGLLFLAWVLFTALCLSINNPPSTEQQAIWWRSDMFQHPRDLIAPMLALMSLVPSLGMTPYFALATRKSIAAIVFTVALVGCMKLLGGARGRDYLRMGRGSAETPDDALEPTRSAGLVVLGFYAVTLDWFVFLGRATIRHGDAPDRLDLAVQQPLGKHVHAINTQNHDLGDVRPRPHAVGRRGDGGGGCAHSAVVAA